MKKVTITFGRMNPPTVGHEKLVGKLMMVAKSKASQPRIYLSHSQNARKDPLSYKTKVSIARAAFGKAVKVSKEKNIVGIMKSLEKEKFTDVTLVVGSDRVSEFRTFLNKYNGKEYNFNSITVVSAGERDPDAEGVAGMSASKMRALAKAGDESSFVSGAPSGLSDTQKKKLYKDVRQAMNIHEAKESEKEDDLEVTDDELDSLLAKMSDEDLDPDDDDVVLAKHIFPDDADELEDDEEEDEDEDEEEMKEARVLSFQQRQKIAQRMRRLAKRFSRLRAIKRKRMATPDRLKFRARKAALMILRRRAAGSRGAKYNQLSRGEKIAIDKMLATRYKKNLSNIIGRFASRMMPRIRKKEMERLARARGGKAAPSKVKYNESFDAFINEAGDPEAKLSDKEIASKIDMLLRMGLVPKDELQKYRRALRNKEAAIKSPELRGKVSDLLNRLLKTAASDPTIYQKLRMKAGETKEAVEYAADYKMIKTKVRMPDGTVKYVWKKQRPKIDIGMGKNEAKDPLAIKHDREQEALKLRQTRERAAAQVKKVRQDNLKDDVSVKAIMNLQKKAENSGIDFDTIFEVFVSEEDPNKRFNRVNSFVANSVQEKTDKESGLPQKYVSGLSTSTAKARASHWKKTSKYSDRDPRAYEPAPGDATAKTKPSKYTTKFKKMYGEEIEIDESSEAGLAAKAAKSGVSIGTLRKVYRRGVAAWNSGHRPGTTPQQWGMARVNSYITKGKTYHTADSDLREASSLAQQAAIAIAMKKAGKKPKSQSESIAASARKYGMANIMKARADAAAKKGPNKAMDAAIEKLKKAFGPEAQKKRDERNQRRRDADPGYQKWKETHKDVKEASSALKRLQAFDKSRVAAGKPAIFDANKKKEEPKKPVKEEGGAGEWGTDKLTKKYKKDTPGEVCEAQPNKFTSSTVLITRMGEGGQLKQMRIEKNKVNEYLARGWKRK